MTSHPAVSLNSRTHLAQGEVAEETNELLSASFTRCSAINGSSLTARLWQISKNYAGDWVLTIALAGALWSVNRVYGFRSQFSLTDKNIQYSHIPDERVPIALLAVAALVAPVIVQAAVTLGLGRLDWYDFHQSALGLLLTHGITLTVTTVIKVSVGRCRPDFIDRCQPFAGATDPLPFGLSSEAVCTTPIDTSIISDGFRSFPSGHSSTAFAGLSYLTLFLAGHFHLFGDRARVWVSWLVFTPPLGAALIGISRLMDHRHHPSDVISGSLLGAVVATCIYHQYYPPLYSGQSHQPYKPSGPASNLMRVHGKSNGQGNGPYSDESAHGREGDLEAAVGQGRGVAGTDHSDDRQQSVVV